MLFEIALCTVAVLVKRAIAYADENKRLASQLTSDSASFEREYQRKAEALQSQNSLQKKKECLYAAEQKIKLLKQFAQSWYLKYVQRKKDLKRIKKNLRKISAITATLHRNRRFFFLKKMFGLVKISRAELDANIQDMEYLLKDEKQRFQYCLSALKQEYAALKKANKKVSGMKIYRGNMKRSILKEKKATRVGGPKSKYKHARISTRVSDIVAAEKGLHKWL